MNDGTARDENLEVAMCAQFLKASTLDSPSFTMMESLVHGEASLIDEERALEVTKTSSFPFDV